MKKYFIAITLFFLVSTFGINIVMAIPIPQNSMLINYPVLSSFSSQQLKEIHKIIHNYPVNNPKMLIGDSNTLQKQAQAQREQQHTQKLFNNSASPVAGNSKSNITLVKFFDYQYDMDIVKQITKL